MLYLCCAMVVDVAVFTMGLTMSIIDVNRYSFGLYLVLMSVVTFSLLVALWVAKPKFCQTPRWALQFYFQTVKSSRSSYHSSTEAQILLEKRNADEIMRSIKGIPLLIQAIQYSLETAYASQPESTAANRTISDSAIESAVTTTQDYGATVDQTAVSSEHWIENETGNQTTIVGGESGCDNEDDWRRCNGKQANGVHRSVGNHKPTQQQQQQQQQQQLQQKQQDKQHQQQQQQQQQHQQRSHSPKLRGKSHCHAGDFRLRDLKRRSIFLVFPFTETAPIDRQRLQLRRFSSDCDLRSKVASDWLDRLCDADQRHRSSDVLNDDNENDNNENDNDETDWNHRPCCHPTVDAVKRADRREKCGSAPLLKPLGQERDARRPSLEVRYVGLQAILVAKMNRKQ